MMKFTLSLFIIFQIYSVVLGQQSNFFNSKGQLISDTTLSITTPNSYPTSTIGENAMIRLILDKIRYPAILVENDVQGNVIIKLNFDESGNIIESSLVDIPDELFEIVLNNCTNILKSQEFTVETRENSVLYLPFQFIITENRNDKYFEDGSFKILHQRPKIIVD